MWPKIRLSVNRDLVRDKVSDGEDATARDTGVVTVIRGLRSHSHLTAPLARMCTYDVRVHHNPARITVCLLPRYFLVTRDPRSSNPFQDVHLRHWRAHRAGLVAQVRDRRIGHPPRGRPRLRWWRRRLLLPQIHKEQGCGAFR